MMTAASTPRLGCRDDASADDFVPDVEPSRGRQAPRPPQVSAGVLFMFWHRLCYSGRQRFGL